MITDTTIGCNEETIGTEDESIEGIDYLRAQISKLSLENERYKQESHDHLRKLEISRSMEAELGELNKTLQRSLDQQKAQANRRIHEFEEKHATYEKELQDKLVDAEAKVAKIREENRALRETIRTLDEKFLALDQFRYSTSIEDNTDLLKSQIEELRELLNQETHVRKQRDETLQIMGREFDELKEIIAATKEQLKEKNKVAESMREELFDCRMELESLKAAPATDKSKGNSLFAEVEDRRKMTLGQMNAMRSSYIEAKRSYQAKEAEIRSLKAERSLLLRKWEDDTVEKIQQDASLVEKYKARIGELETRLKDEEKKQKQNAKSQQLPENNFTFLQSLVDGKSKEIEELNTKIENDSIKALLDEENKHKMGKQLRYWRYRAMSGEAELLSIKNRLESDPSSSNVEILETIKNRLSEKNSEINETLKNDESSYRESTFVNETIVTLDSLMTIPKPIGKPLNIALSNSSNIDETIDGLKLSNDDNESSILSNEQTIIGNFSMEIEEETYEISRRPLATEKHEDRAKNLNSGITTIEPILKSMLCKNNDDTSFFNASKDKTDREKKTLRFTADTIDPPSKTLKKQIVSAPKYPLVFISSNKSKK